MFHILLRLTLRMMICIPALLSLLWPILTASGLTMAILGAWVGVLVAEIRQSGQLRSRTVILLGIVLALVVMLCASLLSSVTIFSTILGPTGALQLRSVLMGAGLCGVSVWVLRVLAKRSGAWFAIELSLIALCTAFAFFPHQYKIIMRPLWLSDLAWSYGLEPSIALGFIGVALASMLAVLTVFDRSRKLHPSVILLPLLALLALIFIDPMQMDTPPPPQRLNDLTGESGLDGQSDPKNGGDGRKTDGKGKGPGEGEQHLNSGQSEKNGEGGGQAQAVAIMLLSNDYDPPSEYYYLRQEIHSKFNGIRLSMPTDSTLSYEAIRGFPVQETLLELDFPKEKRHRVVADVALLTQHSAPFAIESMIRYTPTINPRPGRFVRTYETESWAIDIGFEGFLDYSVGHSAWNEEMWDHHTQSPLDPRYLELAQQIVSTLPENLRENKVAQAFAVKLFLDKKTQYTMKERHNEADDPTAEFLFGPYKQFIGYCVHTSHAAVYLWRVLGIPARIGVGYATSAEQQRGSAVMVLNSDAHSWSEFYVEELGWVILDIAPETVLDGGGEPPDLELLDALEELARAQPDSQFRQAIDWTQLWSTVKPLLKAVVVVSGITALLVLYGRKFRRRLFYRLRPTPYGVYISALDCLSENGYKRAYGESRESFAARLQSAIPSFERITWAQLEYVFGANVPTAIEPLLLARRRFSVELSQTIPLWRRILGLLHPFSTYQSK